MAMNGPAIEIRVCNFPAIWYSQLSHTKRHPSTEPTANDPHANWTTTNPNSASASGGSPTEMTNPDPELGLPNHAIEKRTPKFRLSGNPPLIGDCAKVL